MSYKIINFLNLVSGVLLDGLPRVASERGRLPANAERDHSTGRRRPPADGQHLHIPTLRATVQFASRAPAQAAARHKDQKLRIRLNHPRCYCVGLENNYYIFLLLLQPPPPFFDAIDGYFCKLLGGSLCFTFFFQRREKKKKLCKNDDEML